jgi:hypothetical protein
MSYLAENFDLTNEFNILRLICGLFFIPHIYAKFFVPEALGFFVAAKFNPPARWMYTACVIETILAIGLIFAILPMYAAAIACASFGRRRRGLESDQLQMVVEYRRLRILPVLGDLLPGRGHALLSCGLMAAGAGW